MTPEQLAEIEARDRARTPGVWGVNAEVRKTLGVCHIDSTQGAKPQIAFVSAHLPLMDETAAFIAACSTAVPALCTALREAWMEIQQLKAKLKLLEPADY